MKNFFDSRIKLAIIMAVFGAGGLWVAVDHLKTNAAKMVTKTELDLKITQQQLAQAKKDSLLQVRLQSIQSLQKETLRTIRRYHGYSDGGRDHARVK